MYMKFKKLFLLILFIPLLQLNAFVSGSVSAPAGSFDATLKVELMRGLAGPENIPEDKQTQKPSVNIYEMSLGYNLGNYGIFKDLSFGVLGGFYTSKKEDLAGSPIYPKDDGAYAGAQVSFNFIHDTTSLVGMFIRNQNPIGMNVEKFINPKLDRIGLGFTTGFSFTDSFSQESLFYFGSGIFGEKTPQNPSVSATLLWSFLSNPSWFEHGLSFKAGPFFDADIKDHDDPGYGTKVRSLRAGLVGQIAARISPKLSLSTTYVQKFTGAYFRATQDFILEIKTVF